MTGDAPQPNSRNPSKASPKRRPSSPPIELATVHACHTTEQADYLLDQPGRGYVYQRDGHPNADQLAERCAQWHSAEKGAVLSSGMAALAAVLLSHCESGDHVVASEQLYGKTFGLLENEAGRYGIKCDRFDVLDLDALSAAIRDETKLVVVETISNPRLRVADLSAIAEIAHRSGALLVVDNTFATPVACQPLTLGADLVMESMTKLMNGHGDVTLGCVCGSKTAMARMHAVATTWGLVADPFSCWLAFRGLKTLGLRVEQANRSARRVAQFLDEHAKVRLVDYPGLVAHPDHQLANRLFRCSTLLPDDRQLMFGNMVTFHLHGDEASVDTLIASTELPFFPSLGDTSTSFSHPMSTSHRKADGMERGHLGIEGGTVRVSVGIEPTEWILSELEKGLVALDG